MIALAATVLFAACGGTPGTAVATRMHTSIATVGSGAACIPDLDTTQISFVAGPGTGATGAIGSGTSAQQVREGVVPAPPRARLITSGEVAPARSGSSGALPLGHLRLYLYQTTCSPSDVRAYYVAVLRQNQWSGDFTPASGAMPAQGQTAGTPTNGANVTLFDLADFATGRFVNVHSTGDSVAFIEVLAAIESPGTAQERHPTYVQVIVQPSAATSGTKPLPLTAVTTPNVGASAAPPPPGGAAP